MSADNIIPLDAEIRRRIELAGPMSVAQYMTLCLTHPKHGYYITRNPLGAGGDFTTAPEISQMFGELIGLWAAAAWRALGSPERVRLVELGPGRGTMMVDAMRAGKVMPGFYSAVALHMVEISPVLERVQRQTLATAGLPAAWHRALEEIPEGPVIIIANEFFDALPVHQAVMCADGWHERVVKIGENAKFHFSIDRDPIPLFDEFLPSSLRAARIGEIFEWRADKTALELGRRLANGGGAVLILDYGHVESGIGDTLQGVSRHGYADPLAAPGLVDLTAHVDFQALAQTAKGVGVRAYGPVTQAEFLRRLGIEQRAAALKASAPEEHVEAIAAELHRLTNEERTGMGGLIKALALTSPNVEALPGFES